MASARGVSLPRLVALGIGFALGFLPQVIAWRVVFGRWVVLNPYSFTSEGHFDWGSPHFVDVLFSTNRGLFVWTPVAALGLWGLVRHLPKHCKRWAYCFLLNLLAQVYVIGSWSSWQGSVSFGQRFLVNSVPGLALGLAALYEDLAGRWGRVPVLALGAAFASWNLVLLARYGLEEIPRQGSVSLRDLWLGQFSFVADLARHAPELWRGLLR